jgi:hypothetical protein
MRSDSVEPPCIEVAIQWHVNMHVNRPLDLTHSIFLKRSLFVTKDLFNFVIWLVRCSTGARNLRLKPWQMQCALARYFFPLSYFKACIPVLSFKRGMGRTQPSSI